MNQNVLNSEAVATVDHNLRDRVLLAFSKMYLFVVFAIILAIGAVVSP